MLWKKEKIAIAVLILILLAVIGFMVYKYYDNIEKEDMFKGSTEGSYTTLLDQRMELEGKINDITDQMTYSKEGPLVVLFAQPMDQLEDDAIPAMTSNKYKCVIAVSEKYFPGDENCISVGTMKKLTEAGWEIALSCTRDTDVKALYKRVTDAKMSAPVALYYGSGTVTPDIEAMKSLKINTVIRYNVMPDYYTGTDYRDIETIFAYGCNDTGRGKKRRDLMEKGECFTYVLGFLNNRDYCSDINAWVEALNETKEKDNFKVTNVSEAKAILKENRGELKKNNKDLYNQREDYIKQLTNLNVQIEAAQEDYDDEK